MPDGGVMELRKEARVGARVRSRIEDCDTDERGELRTIPVGTIGRAVAFVGECYDIEWENGAVTRWTPDEVLSDADILD
jgi:hypothetical protein